MCNSLLILLCSLNFYLFNNNFPMQLNIDLITFLMFCFRVYVPDSMENYVKQGKGFFSVGRRSYNNQQFYQ